MNLKINLTNELLEDRRSAAQMLARWRGLRYEPLERENVSRELSALVHRSLNLTTCERLSDIWVAPIADEAGAYLASTDGFQAPQAWLNQVRCYELRNVNRAVLARLESLLAPFENVVESVAA